MAFKGGDVFPASGFVLILRILSVRRLMRSCLGAMLCLGGSYAVRASPPFDANDAMITASGHTELYMFNEFEGLGKDFAGVTGLDLTHGITDWMQFGVVLPLHYDHVGGAKWRSGFGDIEVNTKIKLLKQENAGITLAIEPSMTLPTAKQGFGAGKVSAFLPVWVQHDMGQWSIYGGGGYHINPGAGAHNNWTGSIVVTHDVTDKFMIGLEATREGPDAEDAVASSALRLGASYSFNDHAALLLSGGLRFEQGGGTPRFHGYLAVLLDF
jgi:hypothetical protein